MTEPAPTTYGGRFLREVRARLNSTGGLKYTTVQALEGADREEFGRLLRRECSWLPYEVSQRIDREEPEDIARWFVEVSQSLG